MRNLLFMPISDAGLQRRICEPRERQVHTEEALCQRSSSSDGAGKWTGLPTTLQVGQWMSCKQMVDELHTVLLLMHLGPVR